MPAFGKSVRAWACSPRFAERGRVGGKPLPALLCELTGKPTGKSHIKFQELA